MKVKLRITDLELTDLEQTSNIFRVLLNVSELLRHPQWHGEVFGSEHWSEIRIISYRVVIVVSWFDASGNQRDETLVDQIGDDDLYDDVLVGLERTGILKIDKSILEEDEEDEDE